MYMSTFYGVVDRRAGMLRYGNAGHPHAFVISKDGAAHRLPALDPPLGMGSEAPSGASRQWREDDVLLLFTDGISDARNRGGERLGEARVVEAAIHHRADTPSAIVEAIFALLNQHTGDTRRRDDLTIVVLRS
jgi:sigma-B regulation protein RsbU (phosphoserine phosphatase)